MKKKNILSNCMLLLTALIWGFAFAAQSDAMEHIGPFTFNMLRNIIAGVFLIPCIAIIRKLQKNKDTSIKKYKSKKQMLTGGVLCGILLFISSSFQQIGIIYTSAGKSGFITALYIIIVPILGIFFKKKISKKVWLSAIIAVIGFYLLCINAEFSINIGDLLTLACALFFSFHILIVDYYSPRVEGVVLSCIQFFVCGILSLLFTFIFEKPNMPAILNAWVPILYAGVLSSAVGYTLQILAQNNTEPTIASLIMSLESVFAALAGWLILNETLGAKELAGCCLVFTGIVITQLPSVKFKQIKKQKL